MVCPPYFSLASYSLAHRALQENQWDLLEQILFIYRNSDPENAEAWYLTAILNTRKQKPQLALKNLEQCRKLGFKDQTRFENEPSFQNLRKENPFSFH